MLVIQSDPYNASRLATVLTRGDHLEHSFGGDAGQRVSTRGSNGTPRDSVVNVTALVTLNKTDLSDRIGNVPPNIMDDVDRDCGAYWVFDAGLQMP